MVFPLSAFLRIYFTIGHPTDNYGTLGCWKKHGYGYDTAMDMNIANENLLKMLPLSHALCFAGRF